MAKVTHPLQVDQPFTNGLPTDATNEVFLYKSNFSMRQVGLRQTVMLSDLQSLHDSGFNLIFKRHRVQLHVLYLGQKIYTCAMRILVSMFSEKALI